MFQAPVATTPAAPAPTVAWVSRTRFSTYRGLARAPDGSIVAALQTDKRGYHSNLARIVFARRPGTAPRVVSIGTSRTFDPRAFASSGESVFVVATGKGVGDFGTLQRIKGPGEAPGPTVLGRDTLDVDSVYRLDHEHVGMVADRPRKRGHDFQAATLRPDGIHWLSKRRGHPFLSQLYLFNPVSDETGTLVEAGGVAWHYPDDPVPFVLPPGPVLPPTPEASGQQASSLSGSIGSMATGVGDETIWVAETAGATLKVPTYAKDGSRITTGFGDDVFAIVTPGQVYRTVPVPISAHDDAACLQGSATDQHDIRLGQLWNGPDGGVWSIAGCSAGGATPVRAWLVRLDRSTGATSIVRLPSDPRELAIPGARGVTGPGGVMDIATPTGMLTVSGLQPAGPLAPEVRNVRRADGGRVRADVRCVGTVGQACFGRVRFSDARGTLGTLDYGVDAGSAAMDPIVVRELTPHRAVRGTVHARLLP